MELEDLLARWRTDPTRYGEQLGRRLYTVAYRYIAKRVRDDSAKDLAQATVETALVDHAKFKGGSLQSWVNKIAYNKVRNHWRREQRELALLRAPSSELPAEQTTGVTHIARQRQRRSLRRRIQALATPYRVVVDWHLQGLDAGEIARELGLVPGTVRVRLHRAVSQLQAMATPY